MKQKYLFKSVVKKLGITAFAFVMAFGFFAADVKAKEGTDSVQVTEAADEAELVTEFTYVTSASKDVDPSFYVTYADGAKLSATTSKAIIRDDNYSFFVNDDTEMLLGKYYNCPALPDGYGTLVQYHFYFEVPYSADSDIKEGDIFPVTMVLPIPTECKDAKSQYVLLKDDKSSWADSLSVADKDASTATIQMDLAVQNYNGTRNYVSIDIYAMFEGSISDDPTDDPADTPDDTDKPTDTDKPDDADTPDDTDDFSDDEIPEGPTTWVDKSGVEGFVLRLYNVIMLRDPEEGGSEYWQGELNSKELTAAEVAQGYFFGDEFKSKKYTDVQFIKLLYRTIFGREADAAEIKYWLGLMENGMSREYIYKNFAESAEFTGMCEGYGIERGNVNLTAYRDRNIGATGFMSRLYTKMMDRPFDEGGLEYWCEMYLTNTMSLEDVVFNGFTHSPEFNNLNLSNEEFVKRMYLTILGRDPKDDKEGLAYWVNELDKGNMTKDDLVYNFAASKEFSDIKASYGL